MRKSIAIICQGVLGTEDDSCCIVLSLMFSLSDKNDRTVHICVYHCSSFSNKITFGDHIESEIRHDGRQSHENAQLASRANFCYHHPFPL